MVRIAREYLAAVTLAVAASAGLTASGGAARSQFHVVTNGFTSWVAIPDSTGGFDGYGFAQENWYLRGKQGLGGMMSTLVPGDGVVLRGRLRRLPEREDGDPTRLWEIAADTAAVARMKRWLERNYDHARRFAWDSTAGAWVLETVPAGEPARPGWTFHPSELDYTVWWNCHNYVLRALREAGVVGAAHGHLVLRAHDLSEILTERFGEPVPVARINERR